MGFPARMKRFYILVHRSSLENLVKDLHQSGLVQITDTNKADKKVLSSLDFSVPHYYVHSVEKAYLRVEKLLEILNSVKVEREIPLKEKLFPKPIPLKVVDSRNKEALVNSTNSLLDRIESNIVDLSHQREETNENISTHSEKLKVIKRLEKLNVPLKWVGDTKYTHVRIGLVKEFEKFEAAYQENHIKGFSYFVFDIGGSVKEQGIVAVSIMGSKKEMDTFLHKTHFTDFDLTSFQEDRTPSQYQLVLTAEEKKLLDKKDELEARLRELGEQYEEQLEVLFEELEVEHDRDDVVKSFGRTKDVSVVSGWVPVRSVNDLRTVVSKYKTSTYLEDPDPEDESIPIKLYNNKFIKPFETMTGLFGLPKYNEMDPTTIMAIGFTFYFGVMLGDAGYGLIMLIACLFMYFSLGRVSPFARTAGYIGICLSTVTILAGLYFGSFFGDLIPRYLRGNELLGLYPTIPYTGAPYDALRSPMGLLLFSLAAGVITINIAILLGAITNIRNKQYKNVISVQLPWIFLQPGAGLLVMDKVFGLFALPTWGTVVCAIAFFLGIGLLFIKAKGMFMFDLTGYLGDWLSFTRLMALGLGTTGIALVINVLVSLIMGAGASNIVLTIIMSIVGIILLIALHSFNLALQALGAGIHSMRLQFVETFGRFIEGGGEEFTPFTPTRTLTKIKK